ncbi:hypothetical protein LTR94_029452, partial [Friedmanniomyces endolithicus]
TKGRRRHAGVPGPDRLPDRGDRADRILVHVPGPRALRAARGADGRVDGGHLCAGDAAGVRLFGGAARLRAERGQGDAPAAAAADRVDGAGQFRPVPRRARNACADGRLGGARDLFPRLPVRFCAGVCARDAGRVRAAVARIGGDRDPGLSSGRGDRDPLAGQHHARAMGHGLLRRARGGRMGGGRRADRLCRRTLEPRPSLAPDADRGGVPLLHRPPVGDRGGRLLAARHRLAGVAGRDRAGRRDGGGVLGLLPDRP